MLINSPNKLPLASRPGVEEEILIIRLVIRLVVQGRHIN